MIGEEIKILLVEDSKEDADLVLKSFQKIKIDNEVKVVDDGEKALDFLYKRGEYKEAFTPGLVLLDINLPKLNGFEVLAEIKKHDELKVIPVFILTSSECEEDRWKAYSLHANCYIRKPVDLDEFKKIVGSISNMWFEVVKLPNKS